MSERIRPSLEAEPVSRTSIVGIDSSIPPDDVSRHAAALPYLGKSLPPDELVRVVFEHHQAEVRGTLYHMLGNLDDAHDALQETFIKLWRHREELVQVSNPRAWMFKIALNTARDMAGSAWRRKREALPEMDLEMKQTIASPEDRLCMDEQLARLRLAISELRDEEKEVLLLRQNGELTYEEIAEQLGMPIGTVKTRMRQAVLQLRSILGEEQSGA